MKYTKLERLFGYETGPCWKSLLRRWWGSLPISRVNTINVIIGTNYRNVFVCTTFIKPTISLFQIYISTYINDTFKVVNDKWSDISRYPCIRVCDIAVQFNTYMHSAVLCNFRNICIYGSAVNTLALVKHFLYSMKSFSKVSWSSKKKMCKASRVTGELRRRGVHVTSL